jgi:hypothetical protein
MGEEVKVFYRYIRPRKFNDRTFEFDTLSNGGVCLRFQEGPDNTLWFTYARCHRDDHFKKDVARLITDKRAYSATTDARLLYLMGGIPYTQDPDVLAMAVIDKCRGWQFSSVAEHPLIVRYMTIEWMGLADELERIIMHNAREIAKAQVWITAAGAMDLVHAYATSYGPPDA